MNNPGIMRNSREQLTVEEAVRRILLGCQALPEKAVKLREARGLVLARDVVASTPSPHFDTAAMDGFAVQEADVRGVSAERPVTLGVIGSIAAGEREGTPVAPGTAVRIMTGAACPVGAEVVIPFELIAGGGGEITITRPFEAGANIRRRGEDIAAGATVVSRGKTLGPAQLGAIAAEGHESIEVIPRPRVAVIATGDELVAPGQAIAPGQIWDSNSILVSALIEQFGGEAVASLIVPDDPAAVATALRQQVAEGADLLVTVGGASLGDRDVLGEIESEGIALACWSVIMKPGRPLVSGLVDGVPLIGLPGNPAAAFVSAIQFARPAVVTLCGRLDVEPPTIIARTTEIIPNPGGRRTYVRMLLDTDDRGFVVRLAGPQNVANLLTLSLADCLMVIPEGVEQLDAGARCDVQVIRDL